MRNPVTFGISFIPKTSKTKNGTVPLYARLTLNGDRAELSLQRRITYAMWNVEKNRMQGDTPECIEVNQILELTYNGLYQCYRELLNDRHFVTLEQIKSKYLGDENELKKLSDLLDHHTKTMKQVLKYGTMKNYYTTEKYLFKFLKARYRKEDIYLQQLNYEFILDFEFYLRTFQNEDGKHPLTNNGVMKHLERLKKLSKLAFRLEWINKDPFKNFKLKFKKAERDFLTQEEIETIENYKFEKEKYNRCRDTFLFACYTGLSWIDVKNLKREHIAVGVDQKLWIFTSRIKSGQRLTIPVLPKAKKLIDKYAFYSEDSGFLLPVYSNQKSNEYLKDIANLIGIKKRLTFHVARHTFATTITLSNGIPIETVSKLLGHTKLSTTQVYARVLEEKISNDMQKLMGNL